MANNNTHHLHREIESLRKQLMKEREESHYDISVRISTITNEVESRILERCIVECMEEANAPTYTEEERIAILTATERLKDGALVTVACSEGDTGFIYDGLLETEVTEVTRGEMPHVGVKIMMNVGNPQLAFNFAQLPSSGVGLARLEFIINNNIGIHPKAILDYPNVDADLKKAVDSAKVIITHEAPEPAVLRALKRLQANAALQEPPQRRRDRGHHRSPGLARRLVVRQHEPGPGPRPGQGDVCQEGALAA